MIVLKCVRCTHILFNSHAFTERALRHLGITAPTTIVFDFGGTRTAPLTLHNSWGSGSIRRCLVMDGAVREILRSAGVSVLVSAATGLLGKDADHRFAAPPDI